jgi:hypothetical protein
MLLYIVGGLAVLSHFGLNRLIKPSTARIVHRDWTWPLIAVFLVHCSTTIYLVPWRWGWTRIKGKGPK